MLTSRSNLQLIFRFLRFPGVFARLSKKLLEISGTPLRGARRKWYTTHLFARKGGRRSLKTGSWKLKRITTHIRDRTEIRPKRGESFLLSVYGRTTDALASGGDEGRGRLR